MNPHQLVRLTRPANNFAMGGIPMHFTNILIADGKPVPQTLFLEIMIEKTQLLIEHIKNHHLGLCLTTSIGNNTAIMRLHDNFATLNSQVIQITFPTFPILKHNCSSYTWRLLGLCMLSCQKKMMKCHPWRTLPIMNHNINHIINIIIVFI